jgi:hypothetical protein
LIDKNREGGAKAHVTSEGEEEENSREEEDEPGDVSIQSKTRRQKAQQKHNNTSGRNHLIFVKKGYLN